MPTTPYGMPARKLKFVDSFSPSSIDPVTRTHEDNREVHDTAAVVAETPEVSSSSQFEASHMPVSGGKLRRQ